MKKNIKLKIILLFAVLGIVSKTFSQDDYKLQLKEYDKVQITDIIAQKNEERILTIDESGKILKYNTEDFSYHSTLKKSDGFFIENQRLINDDKTLIYKSKDSLWVLNSEGKILGKAKDFNVSEIVAQKEFDKKEKDPLYKAKKEVDLELKN
jgi:hypothetical protein